MSPATSSPCLPLGLLLSWQSTSIWALLYGALFGTLHLAGLAAPFAAIAIFQLLSEIFPLVFPSCLLVYGVPDVVSHVHLSTLLYQSVLSINLWVLLPDP